MATQEDMYRESQKTTAKLEQVANLLEKQKAGGTFSESGMKKLEALQKKAEEANKLQLKRENIERKLLGQSEKQYDAMLKQRKVTEESKKAMEDIEAVLGEDAKNNKQYQDAQKRYNKEQAKSQKLESRRNLLSRFKDTKGEKGTGAAVKELGGTAIEGIGKTFKKIGGILGRFGKVFSILVIPALVLLVNSPVWGMLKENIKKLISWASSDDNFLFGKNGVLKLLVDKFGALEVGIAAVLGFFTLKFLGFAGIKAIFVGMKAAGVTIVKALGAGLVALSTMTGIAILPLVAIIAGIPVALYAIYDTFLEVKKAFDEGASVPELIRVAFVNFMGSFGKILDFIKDLIADVLEFFGFEDLAKSFKEFSFEKLIEDFINGIMDGVKSILNFDFKGMFQNIMASILMAMPDSVKLVIPDAVFEFAGIDSSGKKLEDPEVRKKRLADEEAQVAAQEAHSKNITRLKRLLEDAEDDVKDNKENVADMTADVAKDSWHETTGEREQDIKDLQNEKAKTDELAARRASIAAELQKAQAAPVVVAPSSTVNEAPKTSNNVSTSASLKPTGTTGAVANGGGSMATANP
jgi:hypothetical protein